MSAPEAATEPAPTEASAASEDRAPVVTDDSVSWLLPSAVVGDAVTGIDLGVDWILAEPHAFTREEGCDWALRLARPLAHRFEYQLIVHTDDGDATVTDPTNPRRVPGPFGDKSEIRFPDYTEPAWLGTEVLGTTVEVPDPASDLAVPVPIHLFSPEGLAADAPAPLLISHDGSDMAARGDLLSWACAQDTPIRVALLDPPVGFRNVWYAAEPEYSDHIGAVVIPALRELVSTSATIGLGASLGAVSMLTIHRRHPDSLDALALQSGSFFTAELDPQEAHWPQFDQVVAAVSAMAGALPGQARTVPVLMTVGAIEENRANNEQMAGALTFQGYDVDARIVPDAHTMIGWRDAWSPGLDELIRKLG
jgi:enterochelin esterase family protein